MSFSLQNKTVFIDKIDFADPLFSLSPDYPEEINQELVNSIVDIGVLHPPILRQKEGLSYQIISGRKRLTVVRDDLAARSTLCLLLPPEATEMDGLKIALAEAKLSGPLSPYQKAAFVKKAHDKLPTEEFIQVFLPKLDLPPRLASIDTYIKIADIELPIAQAIHLGKIADKTAIELIKMSFRDRMAFFEIINELHLSASNQRKLIEICQELSKRNSTDISTIMTDDELRQIIEHPDANAPQKAANLMKWLTRLRYPRLSQAEDEFRSFCGKLQLPKNYTLKASPSFEQDQLTLTMSFKNRQEFAEKWPAIKQG